LLSFAGEDGASDSPDGAAGAVESSAYVTPVEHPEVFPAASVAVALYVVDESSETATLKPGVAKLAAEPLVTGAPEQSEEV
jgi:hypothetical protein